MTPGLASRQGQHLSGAVANAEITGFIGSGLVGVAAAVFGFYAVRNLRLNRLESQRPFWRYLALVGATGTLYGAAGVAGSISRSRWIVASGHGTLLFCIVFLAFAMREVYYNSTLAPDPDERRFSLRALRRVEAAFVLVIVVEWLGVIVIDQLAVAAIVKGGGSLAFATYGVVFGEKIAARARGTSLDTLRRHLIPVLMCGGLLGFADLAVYLGIRPLLVRSVENVFLVMVGTFLITATIRLQQNVEGLSTGT